LTVTVIDLGGQLSMGHGVY